MVALGTVFIITVGASAAAFDDFAFWFIHIEQDRLTIGTLVVFLAYLNMLYQPMRNLSKLANVASMAASGTERLQEVLNQTREVNNHPEIYYDKVDVHGDITYENVFFGYTEDQPVLKGIHFHIPAGRKIALVGLSGSGKTTLVNLLLRFYEIEQGCIKIDGVDIREFTLTTLRQHVSLVLQDSVLFEGTIRENTCGQRQRLAIARAILRDAPILLLDEPTASLDVEAEAEVMHALSTLMAGRTVFMISHRLNILSPMDKILVLQKGQIIEQGTFKDLQYSNGVFARMLAEQNRYNFNGNMSQMTTNEEGSRVTL